MSSTPLLSKSEEQILVCLGYVAMRWNYVEHCARQILRHYAEGDSIDDRDHLAISEHVASRIERELRRVSSQKWVGPGKQYLDNLIAAFETARGHRNHLIHGVYMTFDTSGPYEAQAVLIPAKPVEGRSQVPTFVKVNEIRPIGEAIHELAVFAQQVMVGFDAQGYRALNADRTPVLAQLPALLSPLQPCEYATTEERVA